MQSVIELALLKEPVPLDVHATLIWLVALDPAVMFIAPVVLQVANAAPATAVGKERIVKILESITSAQPALYAVNVKLTLPAVMSVALGVNVQVVNEFGFANVPVPLDVHVTIVWFVALEPAVTLIAPAEEHAVIAVPATTVIGLLINNVLVETTGLHGGFP